MIIFEFYMQIFIDILVYDCCRFIIYFFGYLYSFILELIRKCKFSVNKISNNIEY